MLLPKAAASAPESPKMAAAQDRMSCLRESCTSDMLLASRADLLKLLQLKMPKVRREGPPSHFKVEVWHQRIEVSYLFIHRADSLNCDSH